jgi:hypothetical protein
MSREKSSKRANLPIPQKSKNKRTKPWYGIRLSDAGRKYYSGFNAPENYNLSEVEKSKIQKIVEIFDEETIEDFLERTYWPSPFDPLVYQAALYKIEEQKLGGHYKMPTQPKSLEYLLALANGGKVTPVNGSLIDQFWERTIVPGTERNDSVNRKASLLIGFVGQRRLWSVIANLIPQAALNCGPKLWKQDPADRLHLVELKELVRALIRLGKKNPSVSREALKVIERAKKMGGTPKSQAERLSRLYGERRALWGQRYWVW